MAIDNFEGLGFSETPKAETVIIPISNDNFNFSRLTLLVQLLVKLGADPARPRPAANTRRPPARAGSGRVTNFC